MKTHKPKAKRFEQYIREIYPTKAERAAHEKRYKKLKDRYQAKMKKPKVWRSEKGWAVICIKGEHGWWVGDEITVGMFKMSRGKNDCAHEIIPVRIVPIKKPK